MATDEVHNLLVKVRPDTGDTEEQLESVNEQFDQTADETQRTAGILGDMSDRLKGFGAIIVGTLVTLAAGIATQVPVIGETASALGAVITAIGLQVDETLRPALNSLNADIFGLADSIATAEGPLGDLVGILGSLAIVGGAVAGVLGVIGLVAPSIASGFATIAGLAGTIAGILSGPLLAAIVTMAIVWQRNILGVRDILESFIGEVIKGDWLDAMGVLLTGAVTVLTKLIAIFDKFKATVQTIFEALGALVVSALKRIGNMAVQVLEDTVNEAIRAIPSRVRSELGISAVNLGTPFDPRSAGDIGAAAGRRLGRRFNRIDRTQRARAGSINNQISQILAALQNTDQTTTLEADGRQLAQIVEPLLGEGAANAGRVNRTR